MKKFYNSILLVLCLTTTNLVAQNVNITTKINGFRHNWDCCNDGASILCIGSNFPDPRYKVWIGYNGTTFSQSTNGPGLYCGASDYTYGADAEDCSTWNPGEITGPAFSNVAATSVNVDMQSWEDDGCGSNCVPDGPSSNPLDACFYNADDTRCGRLRIGAIFFSAIAVMPFILQKLTGNSLFAIGGTGILIGVSVCTDLIKKLGAQASMREY